MSAQLDFHSEAPRSLAEKVIARLPESAFGNTEWVTMTTRTGAEHLRAAIASNRPHRIANAVRSIAHAPTLDDAETLADTICDAIASDGYATHDAETIAQVTNARAVIATVMAELRGARKPVSPDIALLRESVDGYVRLVGLHDAALSERLDAVGTFGERVARSMKLPSCTILDVELAGRLHDVGMIQLPPAARTKPGSHSKREDERIKRHTAIGESFLRSIPSLARLAPIVRAHHERYDGHGYPDGLHGDEIPLAARIISVAGAFVDLVTHSGRCEPLLPHDACRELLHESGAQFDPEVVNAALHMLRYRRRTNLSA